MEKSPLPMPALNKPPLEINDTNDPLPTAPASTVQDGDHVLLYFGDGKKIFAQAVLKYKGKSFPMKINKRKYPSKHLVGLPYGTVLELRKSGLHPLPDGEDILPQTSQILTDNGATVVEENGVLIKTDNRDLLDDNTSQSMKQKALEDMRDNGVEGSAIVKALIDNSATFDQKTEFSKAKYIARKQKKYQPRCRLVRCNSATICEAMFLKDPRKIMFLREDSLAQILSFANVFAGCQVLTFENCMGLVTGALAQRMGGYGKILSLFSSQQSTFTDFLGRFNLTFAQSNTIKWVHTGEIFSTNVSCGTVKPDKQSQRETKERDAISWPCPLQPHTKTHLEGMTEPLQVQFLQKRNNRFTRKLTRHTAIESRQWLHNQADSLIIANSQYDPTTMLLKMIPFLAPSGPFVVFSEFMEPLVQCFHKIQELKLAVNLRLSDTWFREYQVLPNRTHPTMSMSQTGGFILTGVKLSPEYGCADVNEEEMKMYRDKAAGRRGKRPQKKQAGRMDEELLPTETSKRAKVLDSNEAEMIDSNCSI